MGVKVELYEFLTSALSGGEWSGELVLSEPPTQTMDSLALSRSSSLACIRTGCLRAIRIVCHLLVACFLRCLLFSPEDGGATFFLFAYGRYQTTRRYNPEDHTVTVVRLKCNKGKFKINKY